MSDPVLAQKNPATVIAECLARYKATTGVTLGPSDPKRLHLQTFVLLLAQQRQLIDFSGKQSLLRFVSDDWIDILAELWGTAAARLGPKASQCTERFNFASVAARTVAAGIRVTDGTNRWKVLADTSATADHIDALVECEVVGGATNGIATGQIATLTDPGLVPGCTGVTNITETVSGRDTEQLEDYRERLRDIPESRSTCGPGVAYEAAALEASASVADAVALGPDDGASMAGYPPAPGEVHVLVIEGERDDAGEVTSVVPTPGEGVLNAVGSALSAEDVRPLTDHVIERAPLFVDVDVFATYYIGESRSESASEIQAAADEAFAAYVLWQQSAIGRDINPDELRARLLNVGAKRLVITEPTFQQLLRDQSARVNYATLTYGGVEDD